MGNFGKIILGLDNHALQMVLHKTDWNVIYGAIIRENNDVQKKVFDNISARLANLLRYEKKDGFWTNSENAQRKIVSTINELAEYRRIIITLETADEIKRFQKESSLELKQDNFKEKNEKFAEQERDERIKRIIQAKEDEIKNDGRLRLSFSPYFDPEYAIEAFFSFLRERPDLLSCIKRLHLNYRFLNSTEGLIDLDSLEELSLSFDEDDSAELPEYIIESPCKKEISMHNIKILPTWVVNVKNLKSLYLSRSPLSSLPEEFFNLPSLETLDLSYTKLKEFPTGLTKMKSLKEINLLGLPIYAEQIPPELSPDIKLSLSRNLTVIPDHTPFFYEDYVSVYHKIVKMTCDFSNRSRREGLLSLEENLEEIRRDDIYHIGLYLVVEGTDTSIIDDILSNLIEHETDHYKKTLKRIILEAVLSIQAGDNTLCTILKLNSMANIKNDPLTAAIVDYFMSEEEDALAVLLEKTARLDTPAPKAGETEIFRFIKRAVMMADTARKEGLLALEKKVIREKGCLDIFEYGISLLVDKYDVEFIKKILENLVSHETEPAMKTLALIKKGAVLSIARGNNLRILVMKLVSLFKDNFDGLDEILPNQMQTSLYSMELSDNPGFRTIPKPLG
ncbi:hypothetical protein AGMMS49579_07360 [Spirochaetia bacterium]|nr:hypothetical protein AGMMS49579_07360 [Spirochaetia bacterium]